MQFIVAEFSKNWPEPEGGEYNGMTLSAMFEAGVVRNLERGYTLHSWRLSRMNDDIGNPNETIIAVFRLGQEY